MELNEGIAIITSLIEDTKCDHTEEKQNWKCVLEGQTADHLTSNISRDRNIAEPVWPPPTGGRSLVNCRKGNPGIWPHQAHHLIPWQQLQKHDVTIYLAETPPHRAGKMWADNNYSVNHGKNGKFMPYASDLAEWAASGNPQKIAEDLMDLVSNQLHQSRHSFTQYEGADDGYKTRVNEYLRRIADHGLKHPNFCDVCKNNKKANKLPPRAAIVRFVDKASELLERDIDDMDIFVSKRAAVWASNNKK